MVTKKYRIRIDLHATNTEVLGAFLEERPTRFMVYISALCPVCRRRSWVDWDAGTNEWYGACTCLINSFVVPTDELEAIAKAKGIDPYKKIHRTF